MGYRSCVALTEREGLYGVPRLLVACGEHDLSPIVGTEITVEVSRYCRTKEDESHGQCASSPQLTSLYERCALPVRAPEWEDPADTFWGASWLREAAEDSVPAE